jgi:DNA polymerase elongation subunit (family B)
MGSEVRVPRTRPPYPEEFRREAIRLALWGDKPQRQLAKDLGIDPARDDFIKRLVELRADVRQQQRIAEHQGQAALARRLDAIQQAMKVTANGVCYGSPIEMNVIEHRKPAWVTVALPDGSSSYRTRVLRTEKPGNWFNPLIATLVASAGRLLLAVAMTLVAQRGGRYAFCDTDSLFVVATKDGDTFSAATGAVPVLTHAEVADVVERFCALNPYDPRLVPGSVLEIEENFDPQTGQQREIWCYSIASKRYALFVYDQAGSPYIIARGDKRHRSEHGLGHLLPPHPDSPDTDDRASLDDWWEHLLYTELVSTIRRPTGSSSQPSAG